MATRSRKQQKHRKDDFWTSRRLQVIASLPCWDIVLSLNDQQARTAAELAQLIGRTPGALHDPLKRLSAAGIIECRTDHSTKKVRGRPARTYTIAAGALQPPCSKGATYENAVHKATAAGLRLVMRNSELLAHENTRRHRKNESALQCQRWIQFGNLQQADIDEVAKHFDAILTLLAKRRSGTGGSRYRVALMMLPDDFHE